MTVVKKMIIAPCSRVRVRKPTINTMGIAQTSSGESLSWHGIQQTSDEGELVPKLRFLEDLASIAHHMKVLL